MKFNVIYLEETESTNDTAKRLAPEAVSGTVVRAGRQTRGKGRLGRGWESREDGLFFSVILKPAGNLPTILAGVAAANAVGAVSGLSCMLKWPNDVMINGKKVCGILAERQLGASIEEEGFVIVGVGINVNTAGFDSPEVREKATSMFLETGRTFVLDEVFDTVLNEIGALYVQPDEILLERYKKMCLNIGNDVIIKSNGADIFGRAVDINAKGELLVETEGGIVRNFSGEVSVRTGHGYV